VLDGPPEDVDAFERHHAETHTALAEPIPGLQRFGAAGAMAAPGGRRATASCYAATARTRTRGRALLT
jgi:hypothetical protein